MREREKETAAQMFLFTPNFYNCRILGNINDRLRAILPATAVGRPRRQR